MPAMLDDPTSPQHYRRSGVEPHPSSGSALPSDLLPRQVTLRDRASQATVLPFNSPTQLPASLISYLCDQFAKEIETGDTYPMLDPMPLQAFGQYWFGVFGAVMLAADVETAMLMVSGSFHPEPDWSKVCLGSFYTKPNYPGRSSHICNAGFLVTDAARNKGVGKLLGEAYLDWAPKLGYTYSVFNLVYETNVASCRIWDSLGFKRIGRVPSCGNLKSHPDRLIDAIIYGRELGQEGEEETMTEERFDKIRYYLAHQRYPPSADRAEKSRLRSAATHYRLTPSDDPANPEPKLMLKDKEVIADPDQQYDISRRVHARAHAGINKTTAQIAEKYHWIRIKETVSVVIRECESCRESSKSSGTGAAVTRVAARVDGEPVTVAPSALHAGFPRPYHAGEYALDPQLIESSHLASLAPDHGHAGAQEFLLVPPPDESALSRPELVDRRHVSSGTSFPNGLDTEMSFAPGADGPPGGLGMASEDIARLAQAAREEVNHERLGGPNGGTSDYGR